MNSNHRHWLFINALQFIISTCQEIHEKISFPCVHDSLVEEKILDHEL